MVPGSAASVLLTSQAAAGALPEHAGRIVFLDRDLEGLGGESEQSPVTPVRDRNLAYVIYTSGSTGRPKGVAIEHRATVALLARAHRTFTRDELAGGLAV